MPPNAAYTVAMLLRAAEPADALAVARVHIRAWQVGFSGLLPQASLDALSPELRATRYSFGSPDPDKPATLVTVEGDAIRGFVTTAPSDLPGIGQLVALYVDPEHWGRGLAATLVAAGRAVLATRFETAVLWHLVGNARAERFYRIDGWAPDGAKRTDELMGIAVDEVRFRRSL